MNWEIAFWIAVGFAIFNGYLAIVYWYSYKSLTKLYDEVVRETFGELENEYED